jgi:hypothetical protein
LTPVADPVWSTGLTPVADAGGQLAPELLPEKMAMVGPFWRRRPHARNTMICRHPSC